MTTTAPRQFTSRVKIGDRAASARQIDRQGYLNIERCPLTRCGVFPYTKKSIGFPGWESDPNTLVPVLRHPDDVGNPESLATLKRKPIIIGHTMMSANGAEPSSVDDVGAQGTTGDLIEFDPNDGVVYGPVTIWTKTGQMAVDKLGIDEISLGYGGEIVIEEGTFNGEKYAARQQKIDYNHTALVPDGRMGSDIRVLDEGIMKRQPRWKGLGKKLGFGDSATREQVIAQIHGIDASKVSMMDAKALAHFDAEEEVKEVKDAEPGAAPAGTGMTLAEAAEALKGIMPIITQIQGLVMGEGKEAAAIEAAKPDATTDDGMMTNEEQAAIKDMCGKDNEPAMMDGAPLRNSKGHIGIKPRGMSIADARAKGKLRFADAGVGKRVDVKAIQDAAESKAQVTAITAIKNAREASALAEKVSPLVGVFDASEMQSAVAVAEYAAGKLGQSLKGDAAMGYIQARLEAASKPVVASFADARAVSLMDSGSAIQLNIPAKA